MVSASQLVIRLQVVHICNLHSSSQSISGGTTCVWAPVREKNSGPHKVMTYVGGSGETLRQKLFEFRVSEMAFHAF